LVTILLSLIGVYLAYYFYVKKPALPAQLKRSVKGLHYIWFTGWGFDALYNKLLVRPFVFFATVNKRDIVDKFYALLVSLADSLHNVFARTQGGILRWYIMSIVIGAILILTLGLLL
jgi:NADH-quinone oxidoreductase subunit L